MVVSPRPTQRLRSFVRAQITNQVSISIPAIRDLAKAHFLGEPGFMEAFLYEQLDTVIRSQVGEVVRDTRRGHGEPYTLVGETVMSVALAQAEYTTRGIQRWLQHMEEVRPHLHVRLVEMTRPQLLAAAQLRRRQAKPHLDYAILQERLAVRLPDDQQRVQDAWTLEEIAGIWTQIQRDPPDDLAPPDNDGPPPPSGPTPPTTPGAPQQRPRSTMMVNLPTLPSIRMPSRP